MNLSQGFLPEAHLNARRLVLGSMPGVASLAASQYYAFPRNVFWRIMAELFNTDAGLSYPLRLQMLRSEQIALWDVIQTCHRPGSLDSNIAADGMVTNDFNAFFSRLPHIKQVYFNGQKAAKLFEKKVLPNIEGSFEYHTLPSTSPANAAMSYSLKLKAWSVLRNDDPARIQSPGY